MRRALARPSPFRRRRRAGQIATLADAIPAETILPLLRRRVLRMIARAASESDDHALSAAPDLCPARFRR
jgi:hypothetical protein